MERCECCNRLVKKLEESPSGNCELCEDCLTSVVRSLKWSELVKILDNKHGTNK